MIRLEEVSETSLRLIFGDEIEVKKAALLGEVARQLEEAFPEVLEITPSYTTILVEVSAGAGSGWGGLKRRLLETARSAQAPLRGQGKCHELPVFYDHSVGPDLGLLADESSLTVSDIVRIHSERIYHVCAIGFAPGFAFLAEVDERLAMPRKKSPRARVPAGSVGIANQQTAVYPADSPGGWQIIGNCPDLLFDLNCDPMTALSVGDEVRFLPISREEYLKKGGMLWDSK